MILFAVLCVLCGEFVVNIVNWYESLYATLSHLAEENTVAPPM